MNRTEHFSVEFQIAADSFSAGYTFGTLIFSNNPNWTNEQVQRFVEELIPKFPLRKSYYYMGFYEAFLKGRKRKTGNMLPDKKENENA